MALTGLWTGGLSWRRLAVLLNQLPPESATFAALHDADQRWSMTDHLVAQAIDAVRQLTYVQVASKTQKGRPRPKVPEPIPRPGMAKRRPDMAGVAYLEEKRARHQTETEGA